MLDLKSNIFSEAKFFIYWIKIADSFINYLVFYYSRNSDTQKYMILNLPIQQREIFSLRGSVIVNTLKPKWAWTGEKKQDGFLAASGELMKDGLNVIASI